MAEDAPSQERLTIPSKFGPDVQLTFIGSTLVQERYQKLLTPELKAQFPGLSPRSLSFQEYLHNSGLPKAEAEGLWNKATENIFTFEVFKSPNATKGTVLMAMGYEVQNSSIVGRKAAGDRVRHWTEQGYNVIGVKYPEVFDAQVFKEQLLEVVAKSEGLGLDDLIISGHSFGSFALLKAMSLMSEKELNTFYSHIVRLRLHSPPSGREDLSPGFQKLAELTGGKAFKIHASYLKKPSLMASSILEKRENKGEIFEMVVRGPLSEEQSGPATALLAHYRDEAQARRLNDIFSSPRLLPSNDFGSRLENPSNKPKITFSTSTLDFMIPCENVLRLASIFQNYGYDVKVLFIEPRSLKKRISDIGELLPRYNLSPKSTHIAYIEEPWDWHNPLFLNDLMPALEELEDNLPVKNLSANINEPAQILIS